MEKKGDLLNQLAIVSDLVEKLNIETNSNTIVLEVTEMNYRKVYDYIAKKHNGKISNPGKTFTIKLGDVDIVFNMSSDGKVRSS
jgi:CRISPR/Cas system CSM-associated protein Csm2 small subunit